MNTQITDMKRERQWLERRTKKGILDLNARVDGRPIGGASIHPRTRAENVRCTILAKPRGH